MTQTTLSALQRAMGAEWDQLSPKVQQHYARRAEAKQQIAYEGIMDHIQVRGFGKLMAWCAGPLQALVPRSGTAIPVEVYNWEAERSDTLHWRRLFHYPKAKPFIFQSRMEYLRNKEIIEFVKGGLGLRMRVESDHGKLVFTGLDYVMNLAGVTIKLPNWLLAGDAFITESQVGDDRIRVDFKIEHPLWGLTFAYSGIFRMKPVHGDA